MSYTNTNSIKIITTGDEAGTWGDSTNINLKILDVASRGFLQLTISDGDQTLTLTNQPTDIENGHYHAIEFKGSISQERTITLEQNDHKLVYMVLNNAGNTLRFKQGDGTGGGSANAGTITIANGKAGIILADGLGASAKIVDLTASVNVSTATALATARNFSITGDVTASAVSFDGTGNVALSAAITADTIINADIKSDAAIADTKLATISTSGKVSNSATTATNSNTNSAIVSRDGSGNFSAGTITAALSGNASSATQLANARTIGGVSFDGTANIDLPGVNTAGTQNTSGNAASATTAAALTGDVTRSGDFTVDASGDIVLDADGQQIRFKDYGSEKFTFHLDSTPQMNVDGAFEIQSTGDITLNAIGDQIIFADSGTARFTFNLDGSPEIDVSSTLELDVTDYIIFKDEGTERFRLDYSTSNQTQLLAKGTTQSLVLKGSATGEDQRVIIPSDSDYPALQIGLPSSTSLQGSSFTSTQIHQYYFAKNSYNSNPQAPSSVTCQRTNTSSIGGIGATLILFPDHTSSSSDCFQIWSDTAPQSGTKSFNKAFSVTPSGNVTIDGALTKGSGSFKIDHPLSSKSNTHHLVHSFLEGPQADLIYRGQVTLTGGSATVNIDTAAGMSEGTFALLCRDVQCFTSNETGWTSVKGSVSGNTLTITAQDNSCTDTISWMVVGERKDQHMINTDWTDETGKVIVEPKKVVEE